MENLVLFFLATVGLTMIIVDSVVFQPVKSWLKEKSPAFLGKLLDCYQCTGTWCGFLFGLILVSYNPLVVFACGCAGGFVSYLSVDVLNYLEAQSIVNLEDKHE